MNSPFNFCSKMRPIYLSHCDCVPMRRKLRAYRLLAYNMYSIHIQCCRFYSRYTLYTQCSNIPIILCWFYSFDFDETTFCHRCRRRPSAHNKMLHLLYIKIQKKKASTHHCTKRNYKREFSFAKPKT